MSIYLYHPCNDSLYSLMSNVDCLMTLICNLQKTEKALQPASLAATHSTDESNTGDVGRANVNHMSTAPTARPPKEWTRNEAYLRTGIWKGMGAEAW